MYCRECGHEAREGEICLHCGVRYMNSNKYCHQCGVETKENQEICTGCGSKLAVTGPTKYAGFWIRFVAYFIDGLIIGIPIFFISLIVGFFTSVSVVTSEDYIYASEEELIAVLLLQLFVGLISFVIGVLYFTSMHASKWQATLGKLIVGIKVTDLNGDRISFWRALGRYFATILSAILYIGYIIAAFTEKKQSLHDFIASTIVVYKR